MAYFLYCSDVLSGEFSSKTKAIDSAKFLIEQHPCCRIAVFDQPLNKTSPGNSIFSCSGLFLDKGRLTPELGKIFLTHGYLPDLLISRYLDHVLTVWVITRGRDSYTLLILHENEIPGVIYLRNDTTNIFYGYWNASFQRLLIFKDFYNQFYDHLYNRFADRVGRA